MTQPKKPELKMGIHYDTRSMKPDVQERLVKLFTLMEDAGMIRQDNIYMPFKIAPGSVSSTVMAEGASADRELQMLVLDPFGIADPWMLQVRERFVPSQTVLLLHLETCSHALYTPKLKAKGISFEWLPGFEAGEKPKAIDKYPNRNAVWQDVADRLIEIISALKEKLEAAGG